MSYHSISKVLALNFQGKCLVFGIMFNYLTSCVQADIKWEKDVGDEMVIGPSTEGYSKVELRCGAEHMRVEIETENDFDGVIYTRGSYNNKKDPCFKDVTLKGKLFTMNIPFDQCKTKNEDDKYINTLILQHDDDLIMPGDAAFLLECDFSKPRDVPVHGIMPTDLFDVVSRISLSNADPTERKIPEQLQLHVKNHSHIVTFRPGILGIHRDEL